MSGGERWVAETPVVRDRPAKPRPGGRTGKVREVRGEPLPLRLVMAEIHLADGTSECWLLYSNVPPDIDAVPLPRWYYYRWEIECLIPG